MIDVKSFGSDSAKDTKNDKYKALNLLAVQLREKNYAPDFGIDLDFFINSDYEITPKTFTTHILKRLSDYAVAVDRVENVVDDFILSAKINIKDK